MLLLGRPLTEETICDLLENGNLSEIEDLDDDNVEFDSDFLFRQTADVNVNEEEQDQQSDEIVNDGPHITSTSASTLMQPPPLPPIEYLSASTSRVSIRKSRNSHQRPRSTSVPSDRSRSPASNIGGVSIRERRPESIPRVSRKRIWRQTAFTGKTHEYTTLPIKPVRRPIDYYNDYFDTEFLEKNTECTNLYY